MKVANISFEVISPEGGRMPLLENLLTYLGNPENRRRTFRLHEWLSTLDESDLCRTGERDDDELNDDDFDQYACAAMAFHEEGHINIFRAGREDLFYAAIAFDSAAALEKLRRLGLVEALSLTRDISNSGQDPTAD